MKKQFLRIYSLLAVVMATMCSLDVSTLALSPGTGDERGQMMGIVIGVLIASVVVIVILMALGCKKKGKQPPKKK